MKESNSRIKGDSFLTHQKMKSDSNLLNKRKESVNEFKENDDFIQFNLYKNHKKNNKNKLKEIKEKTIVDIFDKVKLGIGIIEKIHEKTKDNKKSLEVVYYNNMFAELLKLNCENKSKDILKILKEFIFVNEEEKETTSQNLMDIQNNANNKIKYSNKSNVNKSKDNFNSYNNENLNNNNFNFQNNKNLTTNFTKTPKSSSSLKFVSRKSQLLKALDLYDILLTYLYKENKDYSNTSNIFEKFNGFNEENDNNNFENYKFYKKEVIEYRFIRQNLFYSVRIQEIDNHLVLMIENLDEEKKQIQNNLIKSIKSQYIITLSHELNNPLNGLVHCVEELKVDNDKKTEKIYKKIKRFKFMIKFFLKNIITNFKFFLNEPIEKNTSNISLGFILDSIKRSLFEFYDYKNIKVIHDFSNLNNTALQYDYFYLRYLLKNIFMYFYYKIPRNGKLIIEIEKETQTPELNEIDRVKKLFLKNNYTSEIESSDLEDNLENKKKLPKEIINKSFINNKQNKKKIVIIFKTEHQNITVRKSSRNIFERSFLENFDIENSVQTLEMLIESINKISILLGIKIEFSNFNKKDSSIRLHLNYYLDEDDSILYNDINEFTDGYDKLKADYIFSINRTIINENKKAYMNPTLNLDYQNSNIYNRYNTSYNYDINDYPSDNNIYYSTTNENLNNEKIPYTNKTIEKNKSLPIISFETISKEITDVNIKNIKENFDVKKIFEKKKNLKEKNESSLFFKRKNIIDEDIQITDKIPKIFVSHLDSAQKTENCKNKSTKFYKKYKIENKKDYASIDKKKFENNNLVTIQSDDNEIYYNVKSKNGNYSKTVDITSNHNNLKTIYPNAENNRSLSGDKLIKSASFLSKECNNKYNFANQIKRENKSKIFLNNNLMENKDILYIKIKPENVISKDNSTHKLIERKNINDNITFNTYNTYLNIQNLDKLDVTLENNPNTKENFLKRYCYNNFTSSRNNDNIKINNIKTSNYNDNIYNHKKIGKSDGEIEFSNTSSNYQKDLVYFSDDKNVQNANLKNEIIDTDNNDNMDTNEYYEFYDNYDENINNVSLSNKINSNFLKKKSPNQNNIYIKSPRLFFHCRKPVLKKPRSNSKDSKNSKNKKCECNNILLVDDELFNLSSMKFLLKKKKISADSAINGRDCLDKINEKLNKNCPECNQNEYKIIFMDVMMPELDGIEASNMIQEMVDKNLLSGNLKIIISTAHDSEVIRHRTREIKIIVEFISKPVKKSKIDELLNKYYYSLQNIQ